MRRIDWNLARRLYEQGTSYSRIAERLNCDRSTVSYHLDQSQRERKQARCREYMRVVRAGE